MTNIDLYVWLSVAEVWTNNYSQVKSMEYWTLWELEEALINDISW